jgi:hypothetical protein
MYIIRGKRQTDKFHKSQRSTQTQQPLLVPFDDGPSSPISRPDGTHNEEGEESMDAGISLSLCAGPSLYIVVMAKLIL